MTISLVKERNDFKPQNDIYKCMLYFFRMDGMMFAKRYVFYVLCPIADIE